MLVLDTHLFSTPKADTLIVDNHKADQKPVQRKQMKAVTFSPDLDEFVVREISVPSPGPDDVLVQVNACGLNPVDSKIINWKNAVPEMNESWTPGLDVSGTIVEVGRDVDDWKEGDRVLYHGNMFRPHGGFAEYAIHRAATLIRHPDVPPALAAATPCAGWTAWRVLIDKLRITPGDTLLIGGGSGGVGGFAVQIAKAHGVCMIAATCSARNRKYVQQLGATHVIDYQREDIVARIMDVTEGRGVTRALDTVNADNDIALANSLAFEGELAEIVTLVQPDRYARSFENGLTFHQFSLGSAHRRTDTEHHLKRAGESFCEMLESKRIGVPAMKKIRLDEIPAALDELRQQRTVGKIVYEST